MKVMKCNQLGGPVSCEVEFRAEKWEDMKLQSQNHGKEMFEKGDQDHLDAQKEMMELMKNPKEMENWLEKKEQEFILASNS